MAKTGRVFRTDTATDTTLTTTAETVVATVTGVTTQGGGDRVRLRGWVQLLSGAATTTVTLRVRRGSVTGTLVGEANPVTIPTAAGGTDEYEIVTTDTPGEVAGQSYVLTVTQASATGNGTASQASLEATVGS